MLRIGWERCSRSASNGNALPPDSADENSDLKAWHDYRRRLMSTKKSESLVTATTQFLQVGSERYAYRRFGSGSRLPLLCLQHFTGTLDNWDPAVIDPLASGREVVLFDNAGVGRSTGNVPETMA